MRAFNELKDKIMEMIKIDEFAYLTVKDEAEAFAFYKSDTELFSFEEWQKFHKVDYPTIIKNIPVLTDLVLNKKYIAVVNTHKLEPLQKEFQVLNIHSIYLFPVIRDDKVVGFLDIAYVGNYYVIEKDTLDKIQHLVDVYSEKIMQTVTEYNKS